MLRSMSNHRSGASTVAFYSQVYPLGGHDGLHFRFEGEVQPRDFLFVSRCAHAKMSSRAAIWKALRLWWIRRIIILPNYQSL